VAENVYEGLFILDPNRYARDAAGVSGRVNQILEEQGGDVLVSRLWDERRLAYPIKGSRKGTYWLTYFRCESTKLNEINRQLQIEDNVLRHLIIAVEPRIVDTLVSHAMADQKDAGESASSDGEPQDGKEKTSEKSEKSEKQEAVAAK